MVARKAVIVDTETTSLAPSYADGSGTIWELAAIEYGAGRAEHLWRMKPDLAMAAPDALSVGRFYERTAGMCAKCTRPDRAYDLARRFTTDEPHWSDPAALAADVARLLDDATLVIAVPTFDDPYLKAFLRHYGQAPTWHYRARDIGSMAWGYLNGLRHRYAGDAVPDVPPLDASTDDFARALGVDPDGFERHTALGDCRLLAAMLDVILGKPS